LHQIILEKNMNKFKKTVKTLGALGLVGCAALNSPFAMASDAFWYMGGNIGQSKAKIDDARITAQLPGSVSISDDNTGLGYKLFGGYQFNKNFAVEGGYWHLGQFGYNASTTPTGGLSGKIKVQGLNVDAVGMLPLNNRFSVFARLGLQYAEAKDSFSSSGAVPAPANSNPSKSAMNYKAGVGVQYNFNRSLGMRLEAERFRIDDAVGNRGDIDMYTVGLVYRFGQKKVAAAPQRVVVPVRVKTQQYCSILDIQFEIKQTDVQREDKEKLGVLGIYMNKYPDTTAVIEGHTDNVGESDYNLKLSQQRADSVVSYLETEHHIDASRLTAVGYGDTRPIADNDTSEGKEANRRINAVIACVTDVSGLKVAPARITMAMEMEFDENKAEIKPQYRDELAQVANFMKANPSVTATVEGHSDKYLGTGTDQTKIDPDESMKLSELRAQNVVDYLADKLGIARSRLSAEAYGDTGRITYDTSLETQQENRRVNIIINYPKR
jgi:OOP family OmpA-OmpF porin